MTTQTWIRVRDWGLLSLLLLTALVTIRLANEPVLRGVRSLSVRMTADVEGLFADAARYLYALEENAQLRRTNIELSSQVARMREAQTENETLRAMLELRREARHPLLPAQIVSKDITRQQNHAVIDVGSTDSVESGMPVITQNGVIGQITVTSPEYAVVQTYLNTEFRISAMIQEIEAVGIVRWDGEDPTRLLMEHVVRTEDVQPGHRVVTSGYSNIYPRGLPVGRVDSVRALPGRNELLIYLEPFASVRETHYAFVLKRSQSAQYQALRDSISP